MIPGITGFQKNFSCAETEFKKSLPVSREFQKVLLVHLEVQKSSAVKKHADLDDGLVGV